MFRRAIKDWIRHKRSDTAHKSTDGSRSPVAKKSRRASAGVDVAADIMGWVPSSTASTNDAGRQNYLAESASSLESSSNHQSLVNSIFSDDSVPTETDDL